MNADRSRRLAGSGRSAPARAGGSECTEASRSPRPPGTVLGTHGQERPFCPPGLRATHRVPLGTAHLPALRASR